MFATGHPCRRPEIAWRVIDGEAIVVNPRSGLVYPLNPVATRCWELADGQRGLEDIVRAICEEFDALPVDARRDVESFFRELEEKALLVPHPEAEG
jgi:hypothetical protein